MVRMVRMVTRTPAGQDTPILPCVRGFPQSNAGLDQEACEEWSGPLPQVLLQSDRTRTDAPWGQKCPL